MPSPGTCAGEEHAAFFGCALLTSYLFLFIDFYVRTYKKAGSKKAIVNKDVGKVADKVTDKAVGNGKVVANGEYANGNGKSY